MYCISCLKQKQMVRHLFKVAHGCICEDCVLYLYSLPVTYPLITTNPVIANPKYPKEIKAKLDEYLIGQDDAKKLLATTIYNHLKRIKISSYCFPKTNILLIGPTGTGKTALIEALEKIIDIPIGYCDATALTGAGWYGCDVPSSITSLLVKCNLDKEKTEKGIVYIDEFDKLIHKRYHENGIGVQNEFLKIFEGTKVQVPNTATPNHYGNRHTLIDTSNILFILSGAFEDLEDTTKQIGFNEENENKLLTNQLIKYGFLPELVGRISNIAVLNKLTTVQLLSILTDIKNSLVEQYHNVFRADGILLNIHAKALKEIAEQAVLLNTGARGLKSVMDNVLGELLYSSPNSNIKTIDIESINTPGVITLCQES